jgi:DNA-binding NarL/FixJ family response regulator
MSDRVPRSAIVVSVVAENGLVRAYLLDLLRRDPGLRPVSIESILRRGMSAHTGLTYVVETTGLSSPLRQCLQQLKNDSKGSRALVLDEERSPDEIVRLLLSGANGFLRHAEVGARLTRAVRFVATGHFWVPPGVFERYLTQVRVGLSGNHQVTPRENEILDLLRLRLSNKEIADILRIRVSTVKFHVTHILSKLQASSRRDLFPNHPRGVLDRLSSC